MRWAFGLQRRKPRLPANHRFTLGSVMTSISRAEKFRQLLAERILVLDGGMGTMIQGYKLTEADYRGEQFKDWPCDMKGNSDILALTRPDVIGAIHRAYLDAGADIIETNTFTANYPSQADYRAEEFVRDINLAAAKVARKQPMTTSKKPAKSNSWPVHWGLRIAPLHCRQTSMIRHFATSTSINSLPLTKSAPRRCSKAAWICS
jgi:hypothetical protein